MSIFAQNNFSGGMDLLSNDTQLERNKYRLGINVRNRFGRLEGILESQEDVATPKGIKQELVTFGNYIILFVAGFAYYRFYTSTGWTKIDGFQMSSTAPRYWTKAVPLATTNYGRFAIPVSATIAQPSANGGILLNSIISAFAGNTPGLLIQDNINQPQFIFINPLSGRPTVRVTQTFAQWNITYDNDLVPTDDKREYVPIGTAMEWQDGILYIVSQDGNFIYRSVSGRPLDFVVNVNLDGSAGGDATTTSYSVGVGGITALRATSSNALLVTASNAVFAISKNTTAGAPTIFGEYTFIRTFLFNATCLSDRAIIDSAGDTKFISITGVRSFNAVMQQQNEGRNSLFSAMLSSVVTLQNAASSAAILYDNYELYGINTKFGPAIAIFDTLTNCWTSFDVDQVDRQRIKMFAKIELTIQRLYAITEDDRLFTLYIGPGSNTCLIRTASASAANTTIASGNPNNPSFEIKPSNCRAVFDNVVKDETVSMTPFVNNRLTQSLTVASILKFADSVREYDGIGRLDDVDTGLFNSYFSFPDAQQGQKAYFLISWNGSPALTQLVCEFDDLSPMNPLNSQ